MTSAPPSTLGCGRVVCRRGRPRVREKDWLEILIDSKMPKKRRFGGNAVG